ncbi:hypothetical protein C8R46DRAFT_1069820 [Mycena filopes]|nr:hypothetical protein C8R46DRAFT_1069820 [Mycena filopes]
MPAVPYPILYMNFELPPPGQEAIHHPPALTWTELNRLSNIRPFLGWTTYPFVSYDDWMTKYSDGYCPVYNRQPGRPQFELHGVINDGAHQGGFVSVDAHTLIMTPTRLRPGQYHHNADEREWKYYADPADAPLPRRSYGFYRSVVDLGQARGQVWDLFLAMREPMARDDTRPGILIIARKDYAFAIPSGYRPRDVEWTAGCECSSLIKVGDYQIPENGCLEFRDKIAHVIDPNATFPCRVFPHWPGHFEVLSGAGDGIYPVEIIKDPQGLVTCVKVRFDGQGDVNTDSPELGPLHRDSVTGRSSPRPPPKFLSNADEAKAARKRRRKSTGDMLDMTKGFLKDLGSVARRGVL